MQAARLGLPSTIEVILDHAKKHQTWPFGGWSSPGGPLYPKSEVTDCPYFDGAGVNLTVAAGQFDQWEDQLCGPDWIKPYNGPKGRMQFGPQYSYIVRNAWAGAGPTAGTFVSPHGVDNVIYTSFRYYLP